MPTATVVDRYGRRLEPDEGVRARGDACRSEMR